MKNTVMPFFFCIVLAVTASAAVAPNMSPADAVKVLQSSNNLDDIAAAVQIVASDPASRPALIAYFDGPSRGEQISDAYALAHLPMTLAQFHDLNYFKQWRENNPKAYQKFEDDWLQYVDGATGKITEFFAHSNDPAMFDVFKHFAQSKIVGANWNKGEAMNIFIKSVPRSSVLLPVIIDYFDQQAAAANKHGQQASGGEWLGLLFEINTPEADAVLENGMLSGRYNQNDVSDLFSDPDFFHHRYDPRMLTLRECGLTKMSPFLQLAELFNLFNQRNETNPPDLNFPSLETADPTVYNRLLKILSLAPGLEKSDEVMHSLKPDKLNNLTQLLDAEKSKLLAFYAKHGMTPPTDAELEAMPPITVQPSLSTYMNNAKPHESAKLTTEATASTNALYLAGVGAVIVLSIVLFIFRRK